MKTAGDALTEAIEDAGMPFKDTTTAHMQEMDNWMDSMEVLRKRRADGGRLTETQSMLLNLYTCMMRRIEELEDYIEHLTDETEQKQREHAETGEYR